jgi:lipid-binding SYLF domain-containing protein
VKRWTSALLALIAFAWLSAVSQPARAGEEEVKRAENAVRVLKEVMMAPDKRIPSDLMKSAHAIAVIPDVIKAGFVIGGRHGVGLIAV